MAKAKLSKETAEKVRKAGGTKEFMLARGYLPSDYWQRPIHYADKLDATAKNRVRRLVTAILKERKGRKPYTFEVSNYLMENVGFK